jgi:4-hydroxy-tetrahydrodipicolinate synthase
MVLPPYFVKTDADGLLHYFGEIGRVAGVPLMVQDAPLLTQVSLPPALLARLAREVPSVQLVKVEAPPTAPKISAIVKATGSALVPFGGLNCQFMIEEQARGARGMMPGSDLTAEFVAIWRMLERGDPEAAWTEFTRILPLIRYELQPGLGVSAAKHRLRAKGVIACARVRHPTSELDAVGLQEIGALHARLDRQP